MITPYPRLRVLLVLSVLAIAALWLAGCGVDTAPTEPETASLTQAQDGRTVVSLWAPGAPAAKRAGKGKDDCEADEREEADDDGDGDTCEDPGRVTYEAESGSWSVAGVIGTRGGRLEIEQEGESKDGDVSVVLSIPGRALLAPERLEMTVLNPGALSEMQIAFGPSGTDFEKDARLVVKVGKDLVDVDVKSGKVKVEHEGTDEEATATLKVKKTKSGVTLVIKVSGFSVYSLGGGR